MTFLPIPFVYCKLVEDDPLYIQEAQSLKLKTIIFDQPWNQEIVESSLIKRVHNWNELVEYVIKEKK